MVGSAHHVCASRSHVNIIIDMQVLRISLRYHHINDEPALRSHAMVNTCYTSMHHFIYLSHGKRAAFLSHVSPRGLRGLPLRPRILRVPSTNVGNNHSKPHIKQNKSVLQIEVIFFLDLSRHKKNTWSFSQEIWIIKDFWIGERSNRWPLIKPTEIFLLKMSGGTHLTEKDFRNI